MPGSASTWIFNVCVHLLGLPQRKVKVAYTDDRLAECLAEIAAHAEAVDVLVVKSHKADGTLFDFVSATQSQCVLSVRDPRDCMVSLMERFEFSFEDALTALSKSCASLVRFQALGGPLFRYEDQFFRSAAVISDLHRYLNPHSTVNVELLQRLYSQESVQKFIDNFDLLPPTRVRKEGSDEYDMLQHWHRNHFGDGVSGKWQSRLDAGQQAQAGQVLVTALECFGYARRCDRAIA
jgi:hypothetical protein